MARIDARLTREIRESGLRRQRSVRVDRRVVQEELGRDRPGASGGAHAALAQPHGRGAELRRAGHAGRRRRTDSELGGDATRWLALPALEHGSATAAREQPASLGVGHDASNLYLAIALPGFRGRNFPWDSLAVQIALDTYQPERGQHALPGRRVTSELGFEFLVDLEDTTRAQLLVAPDYNPYLGPAAIHDGDDLGGFYHRPAAPGNRSDGVFDSMFVIVNRTRFGRDGTFFPAQSWNRGRLRFGRERESTLSDWYYDSSAGVLEVRIAWALLNVTDPSSATVLDDGHASGGDFGTAHTDGFRIGVVTLRRGPNGSVAGSCPALDSHGHWRAADFRTWHWDAWSEPVFHARLKPVYDSMKAVWGEAGEAVSDRERKP